MTAISVNRRTSIVCALLLVALCLVSSTPSFIERPADVIADVGSTVEIICQIANKSDYTVYWQINNRHMHSVLLGVSLNKAYPRFLFSGDREEGEYNLRIQATVPDDAGSYACLVAAPDNDPGKHLQANANLAFGHIIAPIVEVNCDEYFNIRLDNQEPNQEGSTVGLTCQSRGGEPLATLELQRNGEAMPGQNRTTGYDETGHTQIVYTSVTWELTYEDKNAHFTCAASHPAWVVDHKVCSFGQSLWLSHRPVVTITPSWKRFEEGDSGTFNCTADADPPYMAFRWYFDGEEITDVFERFSSISSEGWSALSIDGITEYDFGKSVVCEVNNDMGMGNRTAKIMGPEVVLFTPLKLELSTMVTIIGVIMFIIFIVTIVIVVIVCCCPKRRKKRDNPNRQDGYNLTEPDTGTRQRPTREEMEEDAYAANVNKRNDGIDYAQFQGGAEINSIRNDPVRTEVSRNSSKKTTFKDEKESSKKKKGSSKKKRGSSKKKIQNKDDTDHSDNDNKDDDDHGNDNTGYVPDVTYATPNKKGSLRSRASNEDNTFADDVESNNSNNQSAPRGHVLY